MLPLQRLEEREALTFVDHNHPVAEVHAASFHVKMPHACAQQAPAILVSHIQLETPLRKHTHTAAVNVARSLCDVTLRWVVSGDQTDAVRARRHRVVNDDVSVVVRHQRRFVIAELLRHRHSQWRHLVMGVVLGDVLVQVRTR